MKMIENSNQKKFFQTLCKYSQNKDPKLAVLEWDYKMSKWKDNKCICGHDIYENCIIINKKNGNILTIGNSCIKKFIHKDVSFIFGGWKKVKEGKMPNKSFINYCFEKGYIFENQRDFLINYHRKRKFSGAQQRFKEKIFYKLSLREFY